MIWPFSATEMVPVSSLTTTIRASHCSDSRPMTGAQFCGQRAVFRQWQEAACRNQTIAADNRSTIMKRRVHDKDVEQKLCRNQSVNPDACGTDIIKPHIALDDQQRTGFRSGQLLHRLGDFADDRPGFLIIQQGQDW